MSSSASEEASIMTSPPANSDAVASDDVMLTEESFVTVSEAESSSSIIGSQPELQQSPHRVSNLVKKRSDQAHFINQGIML